MLKYYYSMVEEYNGYECDGHWVAVIVAAESVEQAEGLLKLSELDRYTEPAELVLPPLAKKRKPHVVSFWLPSNNARSGLAPTGGLNHKMVNGPRR